MTSPSDYNAEVRAAEIMADVIAYDRPFRSLTRHEVLGCRAAQGDSVHRDSQRFQAGYLFAVAMGRDR